MHRDHVGGVHDFDVAAIEVVLPHLGADDPLITDDCDFERIVRLGDGLHCPLDARTGTEVAPHGVQNDSFSGLRHAVSIH